MLQDGGWRQRAGPWGETKIVNTEGQSSLCVLVVDDSETVRRAAESLLTRAGCRVVTAGDGFDSLSQVVEHRPDVVLIDVMMPRLDGYQACSLIKNNPEYAHIPVLLLSSRDGLFDKAKGRLVGADDYLIKPFDGESLLAAISRHTGWESAAVTE